MARICSLHCAVEWIQHFINIKWVQPKGGVFVDMKFKSLIHDITLPWQPITQFQWIIH